VRWVVRAHAILLATTISLTFCYPGVEAILLFDASVVLAQFALLTIWLTLTGQPTLGRTAVVAVYPLLCAAAHDPSKWSIGALLGMVFGLPCTLVGVIILTFPLSMARSLGLVLQRFTAEAMPLPRRLQFSIRVLLGVMVGVAVLFGLSQYSLMTLSNPGPKENPGAFALAVGLVFVTFNVILLSIPLVCVWVVLTPGQALPRLGTALVGWMLSGVLMVPYMSGAPVSFSIPLGALSGGAAVLIVTLAVLRRLGYRVVWEKELANPFGPRDAGSRA
jgi:hypothetical protein